MQFVGPGRGAYTTETTYKYVGHGGEFSYVTPKKSIFVFVFGGSVLALILVIVLIILLWPTTSTTTPPPVGPPGHCLLWGDPHVETFDHGFPNFYSAGEFWIVKTKVLWIQGDFRPTPYTNGLAATIQIAMKVQSNTVIVGPIQNGQITINGVPQCTTFPSTCGSADGVIRVAYNGQGNLVDAAQGHLVKHIVHIDAPMGVHLQVMRWDNHLNIKITMTPRAGGQTGVCGNFNGNAADDSGDGQLFRVAPSENIFPNVIPPSPPPPIVPCAPARMAQAKILCGHKESAAAIKSCQFDYCQGGSKKWALEDKLEGTEV